MPHGSPKATPTASVRLGWAIRSLRNRRKVTIETLALDAGMHPTYLSGIERGKRNPTWGKLCALADALGVPTATIAHEIERATCPTCGRQPDVLHYEGPVYVRPLGRGIVLVNEPSEPLLDDWMEAWLAERDPHRPVSGGEFRARLRIVVEYVCENAQV